MENINLDSLDHAINSYYADFYRRLYPVAPEEICLVCGDTDLALTYGVCKHCIKEKAFDAETVLNFIDDGDLEADFYVNFMAEYLTYENFIPQAHYPSIVVKAMEKHFESLSEITQETMLRAYALENIPEFAMFLGKEW